MGPPELPGGNIRVFWVQIPAEFSLQWGRRNYPAETTVTVARVAREAKALQWGRRNYPAETQGKNRGV